MHIGKIGFEIEGGWKGKPRISPFKDIRLIADHSINGQTLGSAHAISAVHVGEAVSKPMEITDDWEKWLVDHWPDAEPRDRTNRTCGYHIHISLPSHMDYTRLTSKVYVSRLRDEVLKLGNTLKLPKGHVFWERMLGLNEFCTLFFDPARQMKVGPGVTGIRRERYGWLNFSYKKHGTVEFRALPTFRDSHIAVAFTKLFIEFTEKHLDEDQVPLVRTATLFG